MEFTSYKCDECGRVKGEANHWYRAACLPRPRFVIVPWDTPLCRIPDPNAKEQHLCGMSCAIKALAKAMGQPHELHASVKTQFEEGEVNA